MGPRWVYFTYFPYCEYIWECRYRGAWKGNVKVAVSNKKWHGPNVSIFYLFSLFYIPTDGKYQPIDNTHLWDTKEKEISYWMDSGLYLPWRQIYFATSHLGKDEFYDWCLLQNLGRHFFWLDLDSTELMAYVSWVHYSAQQKQWKLKSDCVIFVLEETTCFVETDWLPTLWQFLTSFDFHALVIELENQFEMKRLLSQLT